MAITTPKTGFLHLVLKDPFYLDIPIQTVSRLSLKPLKYLRYLGWCVLGVLGELVDHEGNGIDLDGTLVDRGVYKYIVPSENVLEHAVDPEVIKQPTSSDSLTTGTRENFCSNLLERDGRCVWTSASKGIGMHIIPHRRGDEWLQLIIDNRPHDEDLDSFRSINDIRNGLYASADICISYFDPRKVVVLKTPNPILETTDLPIRHTRRHGIPLAVSYPPESRYTLQWIITPDIFTLDRIPDNNDATFMNHDLPKPADLILHYNYGAAAVKHWGKKTEVLLTRPDVPRPSAPIPAPVGPSGLRTEECGTKRRRAGDVNVGGETTEGQRSWDEDDVVLFFWSNTNVARERNARKEEGRREYMEKWRSGIPDSLKNRS